MRRALLLGLALAGAAAPAVAEPAAWPPSTLARLKAGVEWGTSLPLRPNDFTIGWNDSRGFGAFVAYALSPTVDLVLRAERDRFPFAADAVREAWSNPWMAVAEANGRETRLDLFSLGVQVRHERGPLRAHAGFSLGVGRRTERRMTLSWVNPQFPGPVQSAEWGEPSQDVRALSFGVGLTWVLPRLPDVVAEGRSVWLLDHERVMPLRVGLVVP